MLRIGIGVLGGRGGSWTPQAFNLMIEGHSFMEPSHGVSANLENKIKYSASYNYFEAGCSIANLVTRAATIDSKLVEENPATKIYNIMALWIGVNELASGQTAAVAYAALKAYVQARVAAGWKVFAFTCTPSTAGTIPVGFEAQRVIFNGLMRTDLSLLQKVYVMDTDTLSELDDSTDINYYNADKLHPNGGMGLLVSSDLFAAKIEELYGTTVLTTIENNGITNAASASEIIYPDNIYFTPITVASGGSITNVGIYVGATPGNLKVGIYTNDTNAPKTLLGATLPQLLVANKYNILTFDTHPSVSPSTKYWVGIKSDAQANVRIGSGTTPTPYQAQPYTSALPSTAASSFLANYDFPIYFSVRTN